ncbi:MAG: hypothetical protein AB1586_10360 [Pseudomonadota bacterium]|jgi:hypothetical protein
MNAFVPPDKSAGHPSVRPVSPALRPYPTHPDDMEFLAADLEIIETPPSPIRKRLIVTICALVTAALVWAWIGRVDIIAVAQGKITTSRSSSRSKPAAWRRFMSRTDSGSRRAMS